MCHQELPVLLVQCPTVEFCIATWIVATYHPRPDSIPLKCHYKKKLIQYHLFHSHCDPAALSDGQKGEGVNHLVESSQ